LSFRPRPAFGRLSTHDGRILRDDLLRTFFLFDEQQHAEHNKRSESGCGLTHPVQRLCHDAAA
jgi:hypothetical protein